jgi:hypothetical protein
MTLKAGMELKIYFEIETNGQFSNALVVGGNDKIMKELPLLINNMRVSEAAKNKINIYVASFFMKTIVL